MIKEILVSKKFKKRVMCKKWLIDWLEKRKISSPEEIKKSIEIFDFLIKKKENLLDILSIFEEKTFRQSRELIDNKLTPPTVKSKKEEIEELYTQEKINETIKPIIKGLNLSPSEDRLIHTISLLLSRKSERHNQNSPKYYMGNYETGSISINSIEIETARMLISQHELYSTYLGRNDYNTGHIKFILSVLNDLSKKNYQITITLPSKSNTHKKKHFDKIRTFLPLFQVAILNKDLTESESYEIDNSEFLIEGKGCHFLFKFGPLFTTNIRDRYVEFPEDIHLRIANSKFAGGKGRIPQCVNLMRDLLFREKQQKRLLFERDEESLVHTLGLSKEWESGRKSRVIERLKKSFDIFKEIGLLKTVDRVVGSRGQCKYKIEINPDFK